MNKISKTIMGAGTSVAAMLSSFSQVFAQAKPAKPEDLKVKVPENFFFEDYGSLITTLLRTVMILAGLLVFVYLIWGGIEWITSGGDKGKTENARNKITAAIVGLVILAASYAILHLVISLLGVEGYGAIFQK
jgi:hypothetical protein